MGAEAGGAPGAGRVKQVAVVGGGWAGLAAAVRATQAGHQVTLYEMAAQWGGRARSVEVQGLTLDNGQHILIGAYRRTLDLMDTVGAPVADGLSRRPLELRYPDGRGLRMPPGPAWLGFGAAVLGCVGWTWHDRMALVTTAAGWALRGFRCDARLTVDTLCQALPPAVRQLLIDPLCVAALNTPAKDASAGVFLRVLRDALFSGPGSADLLLPRRPLAELLPTPATNWLRARGAQLRLGQRVSQLTASQGRWQVDTDAFDGVVLACSAQEAARLAQAHAPGWSRDTLAVGYEPIITVYLHCPGAQLPGPMVALVDGPDAPAQYAFDHGALGASLGVFAFVISGARVWVDRGLDATAAAVLRQAGRDFPSGTWPTTPVVLRTLAEKRATFSCTPRLQRPAGWIAPRLVAAGDYVQGPYPATLEGAIRSGEAAATLALQTGTPSL